jgi:hypothetical protein
MRKKPIGYFEQDGSYNELDPQQTPKLRKRPAKKLGSMEEASALSLAPEDFIRWLSHRTYWHGNQYRAACSRWLDRQQKLQASK